MQKQRSALKRLGRGFTLVGTLILGACGTLSDKYNGQAAGERVALGKDLRAAMNTFVPSGDFNPTSYLTLTGIRDPEGKVILAPFLGHWQSDASGKRAFHVAVAGNSDDPRATAFFAGIRTAFADNRGVVGVGTTLVDEKFIQALAAKWNLDENTTFTFSTNPDELQESIFNVQRKLGTVKGAVIQGYLEHGVNNEDNWRLGGSAEKGRQAIDIAFDHASNKTDLRWNLGFGEKGKHFLFVGPTYDASTGKMTWQFGVNFTEYAFGRNSRTPRRKTTRSKQRDIIQRELIRQRMRSVSANKRRVTSRPSLPRRR